ncbi:MAG: tetratricopeptide repeat protein, partial [Deltaproteobacteria bacterium]
LTRKFPKSIWAPASHVFIGEHLFDEAKLAEALKEYRAAAEVTTDEVYPYALYKAAWCRFNQGGFDDAMKLLKQVVEVSAKAGDVNTVQLGREARRDYVLAYGRIGKPETAHDEFVRNFGREAGLKMLEQYGKLLFDTGRDPEAQQIARQLLALHGDAPAAALDQTRLLVIAQRTGKRRDLLSEAKSLVQTFQRVRNDNSDEAFAEANRLGEETLRNLAVQIHNEARKTDLDETWAAARALYADYLKLFPDAQDAYDLRYFYGELLYARGAKAEAAEQYETVVRHGPGKWLQKAAWSAVLSRNEVIFGEQKEAKDTGERRTQRPLTAEEQKLAGACKLYLEALPQGPHAVEVAFKVGRLEYVSSDLDAAQKHLSWIALNRPEHELAEYAANLVLDISNLRKEWNGLHAWAVKFLEDKRLIAHGTLAQDLKRIEEESAYALADAASSDARKAEALLAFVAQHPHGQLADKALFGAAAALSRAGRIDDALAARQRVWKEQPQSPLVPRALVASAADLNGVGDLGEAAALLEQYARGFQKEEAARKWRRDHPSPSKKPLPALYDEAKAQTGLHDAAILREARGELRQAIADRSLTLKLWKKTDDELFAVARLRAQLGENARAAREMAEIARQAKGKPALQLTAWSEAARLFGKAHETGNSNWSWTETERTWKALPQKAREKLPEDAIAAAAAAHFTLGGSAFDSFRRQEIKAPLMATLNRKIALLQNVKKRAEETVAMRQAEPAVCALAQLGEAQILLAQALAQSPFPPRLNADQRKLYRAALAEKAQPIYGEAKETLASADAKARELGVTGNCTAKTAALLEKLGAKAAPRPQLELAPAPIAETPDLIDARGLQSERAKRLLTEAMASEGNLPPDQLVAKFQAAADAEGAPGPALFDVAIALDKAGRGPEAEKAYRTLAQIKGAIGFDAAARLAALAASRADGKAARDALALADAALPGNVATRVLRAEVELALGNPAAAQSAARIALEQNPADVRALCALARAQLAQNAPGAARLLAARAEQADPHDAEPILVKMEVARAAHDPAAELAAAKAAAEADPDSPQAALALGRVLFERGQTDAALNQLEEAAQMDRASYAAALAYGQALAAAGETRDAEDQLTQAAMLAPKA